MLDNAKLNNIKFEVENIHVHLEQVEALHRIVTNNYFTYPADSVRPNSPAMYDLIGSYPDYTSAIEIAHNCIHDINKQLQSVIDMLYGKE